MHSSCAVVTPPSVSAPPALVHALRSPKPRDVSMTPLPLRSTHSPFSSRPTCTTLRPSRFAVHTPPLCSTVVREGLVGCPSGADLYSPRIAPERVSTLMSVPLLE